MDPLTGKPSAGLGRSTPLARVAFREILFLSLISALPPLSTDMYLGAMPAIAEQWRVSNSLVSLSLILWFASFSVALLFFGPLSDRLGRKPVLMGGLGVFALASLGCALSGQVEHLIAFRILQGAGAAGPSAMVMAISRDRYEGQQRKQVLALMGVILALAPMVAPMMGAVIMAAASWRMIFLMQALYAVGCVAITLGFAETAQDRITGPWMRMLGRYGVLFRNRRYMLANSIMGLIAGPMFGFIAVSSVVYIRQFGLSEYHFSILFGLSAFMLMLGALACSRLTRVLPDATLVTLCIAGSIAGGAGVVLFGHAHYLAFAGAVCLVTFFNGMIRPLSNHLILEQVRTDIGSASSFSVFYIFVVGAVSMAFVSAPWKDPLGAYGYMALGVPVVVMILWPILLRQLALTMPDQPLVVPAHVEVEP